MMNALKITPNAIKNEVRDCETLEELFHNCQGFVSEFYVQQTFEGTNYLNELVKNMA